MSRILITGGTGFIGSAIIERLLARGDTVTALTRRVPHGAPRERLRWAAWEPNADGAWQGDLRAQDAVVHLAGSPAVGRRYTDAVRRDILDSRVQSTQRLVAGIGRAAEPPKVFVCASGIGFYGDRPEGTVDERAPAGNDFLARACVEWEGAVRAVLAWCSGVTAVRCKSCCPSSKPASAVGWGTASR
jgi:NAD dependent epimerase/dehydratase family enzyme